MKSFLTIRGNLILVNLVVIGLVLWLAVSFLYLAVLQTRDAQQLQSNVDTERTIFQANNALALERDLYDEYLNSRSKPTDLHYQKLLAIGQESDAILNAMTIQVMEQISDLNVFEHIPTSRSILQAQLENLKKHRTELTTHRDYSLSQYLLTANARDREMPSILFNLQTDTIEDLVNLAKSLKYLPNTKASDISHYQTLLNEVLVVDVELARKNTALNKLASGNNASTSETRLKIAEHSRKVEQHLTEIVSLTQASDNTIQLMPIATQTQMYYQQEYMQAEGRIHYHAITQNYNEENSVEWRSVTSSLSRLTSALAEATHESIDLIAADYEKRAYRNLIIDIGLIILCFAITLASVAINRRIKQYAYYDSLTKLPNRMNFESTLQNTSISESQLLAVVFIDLDRFKSINDNYGHAIGDELLQAVAQRLKENCQPTHLLARLGGDEFAVLISDASSAAEIETMASQMVVAVKKTFSIHGHELKVGASVGVSIAPLDCNSGVALLKNADIAMYHSKANNIKGAYRFNAKIAGDHQERLQLEIDLKKGIENNEFQLVYQPKVCTHSGQVKSVEALLRWQHPERGFVSPAQFIPVAEDTGLMGVIGLWVLNEACREIALLQKCTNPALQVAVNISSQQFSDESFVDSVYAALSINGLQHESLELEVTESIVMTDISRVISMLNTLKESGITIAIDDFGTGYSSLQYLQELPLDTLKIDRAFITALDVNDPVSSVANSIVQLAKLFNLETVAEGVETEDQSQKIKSLGVHHIQGYLYSKPVPADELPTVIQTIELQSNLDQQHVA